MMGDLNYPKILMQLYPNEVKEAKIILRRLQYSGEIEKFRFAWHIKPEGFSRRADFEKWWNQTLKPWADKWRQSEEYKDLQKRVKKDQSVFREYINRDPFFKFDQDLDNVIKRNKIPVSFKDFVKEVLTVKPEAVEIVPGSHDVVSHKKAVFYERLMPLIKFNSITQRNELWIELSGRTRPEDFKSPVLWERIKTEQKKLHDYDSLPIFPARQFEISDKVAKWHIVDNLSYKEIKEKAKIELKYKFPSVRSVGTMIQRYKKYIGLSTTFRQKGRT